MLFIVRTIRHEKLRVSPRKSVVNVLVLRVIFATVLALVFINIRVERYTVAGMQDQEARMWREVRKETIHI